MAESCDCVCFGCIDWEGLGTEVYVSHWKRKFLHPRLSWFGGWTFVLMSSCSENRTRNVVVLHLEVASQGGGA